MKKEKFFFWVPRIFIILFALFLTIFSFDVFDSASSLSEILIGLFMHNLPSMVLLIILMIFWKNDLFIGIIFLLFGVSCFIGTLAALIMSKSVFINPMLIIGSVVFLFIGILSIIGWSKKKK